MIPWTLAVAIQWEFNARARRSQGAKRIGETGSDILKLGGLGQFESDLTRKPFQK
jgi:hypothetical protein